MDTPLLAAIEGGGTKFLCAVGRPGATVESTEIPTHDPAATMEGISSFLASTASRYGPVAAVGIASFGPLDLDTSSAGYGHIAATPKPGWAGFDILGAVKSIVTAPAIIETDVNAAALAEARMGAAQGCDPVAYVTVGTGIGVGVIVGGKPLHGLGHPEGGHIRPRRHSLDRDFGGVCPYHGDCMEGLASGPALAARWGIPAAALPDGHPAWEAEADYLGQLCATLVLMLAPQRIVLGGGVLRDEALYPAIRTRTLYWLNGYVASLAADRTAVDRLIVRPGCAQPSGLAGAFILAQSLL